MTVLGVISFSLRGIVATVLVYYGLTKLFASKIPFETAISRYQLMPNWAVRPIANILPLVETVLGGILLLDITNTVAFWGAMFLLLVFLIAIGSALLRGLQIDCGCSGKRSMSLRLGFLRNLGFLGLLLASEMLQGVDTRILLLHSSAIGFVLLALTVVLGILSAFNSTSTRAVITHSIKRPLEGGRRRFLQKTGMVTVTLLGLWLFDRQDVAFAAVTCDCSCLGDVAETYDCGTYCPSGCGCPCYAPLWAIYYEVCCENTSLNCDTSLAIVGEVQCC